MSNWDHIDVYQGDDDDREKWESTHSRDFHLESLSDAEDDEWGEWSEDERPND